MGSPHYAPRRTVDGSENPVDHITDVEPRSGYVPLPGYDDAARALLTFGTKGAWEDLNLFSAQSALDFLDAPMGAVAKSQTPEGKGRVLTMVLAFAVMAVHADRANRRTEVDELRERLGSDVVATPDDPPEPEPEPDEPITF